MQTCQSGGVGVSRSEEGGETALEDTDIPRCDCKVVSIFSSVGSKYWCRHDMRYIIRNERKSDQAHIPHAPPLHENAVYNKWQFQALVWGNRTENQFHLSCTKYFWSKFKRDINCSLKRINQHFLYIYTWCFSLLQSFTKFCWANSVELWWQTILSSIFHFGQISKFKKGHYFQKKFESKFPVDMHIYTLSPSL